LGEPWFYIEPGRYVVCDAVVLLTTVNTVKVTPYKRFVGVDAGFNTLIRPVMYGSYHPIIVANKLNEPETETYDVAGPLCESGDFLARDRKLPKIGEGDLLAVLNAGAYGFSMSSQYNSRPKCAEVLVKDGKCALVRERETLEALLNGQKFPPWFE
jgi:diaminopimelate decarboxylase